MEVFSRKQKTQISPSLPPDASSSQSDSLTELHTLKSEANLSAVEISDEPLFLPRHNCNLRSALL